MIAVINEFLLSEWLWSITWGVYHIPVNIALMFLFYKIGTHLSTINAIWMILAAHIFSLVVFTLFIMAIVIGIFGTTYQIPTDIYQIQLSILQAALGLGFIYSVLQSCFFGLLAPYYLFSPVRVTILIFLSNFISSLLAFSLTSLG